MKLKTLFFQRGKNINDWLKEHISYKTVKKPLKNRRKTGNSEFIA